ncbi:MAG: Pvc16 family protein [Myxococcota bacterium]
MSTQQSIAAVTYLVGRRLKAEIESIPSLSAVVEVGPPVDPATVAANTTRLFLHRVSPNPTLRSSVGPQDVDGVILANAPILALDLHYLMSFYGVEITNPDQSTDAADLAAQRMLGQVMSMFHREPTFSVPELTALASLAPDWVQNARVGEQLKLLHFELEALDPETWSKLWSTLLQTKYVLSVSYVASVLLVETATEPAPAVAPAVQRPASIHLLQRSFPRLNDVEPREVEAGGTVTLKGSGLAGERTFVTLAGVDVTPDTVASDEVTVIVPLSARAGSIHAAVRQEAQMGTLNDPLDPLQWAQVGRSNGLPLVVRPRVMSAAIQGTPAMLQVDIAPAVAPFQSLILHLAAPDGNPSRALRHRIALRDEVAPVSIVQVPVDDLPESPLGQAATPRRLAVEVDGVRSLLTTTAVITR